ncbi:MAG: hypothetical protein ACOYPR_22155 [Saprospiraceae bacterium]
MKKTILLLGIISLCIQCRMLGPADFAVTPIPTKIDLPRLEILTHQQSFGAMFGNALWGNQFLMYDNSWSTFMPVGYQRSIAPRKILDAMGYLERETAAISRRTGNAHGYARYKLMYYEVRQPGFGWEILSSLTCFIPNFFGMPFNRLRTDLELQLEIVDAQGNILSTYRSAQSALVWSAPYWGYWWPDAVRKACISALQLAMTDIKGQIALDRNTLETQLLAGGQLPPFVSEGYRR